MFVWKMTLAPLNEPISESTHLGITQTKETALKYLEKLYKLSKDDIETLDETGSLLITGNKKSYLLMVDEEQLIEMGEV